MIIFAWIFVVTGLADIDTKIQMLQQSLEKYSIGREKLLNREKISHLSPNPLSITNEEWQLSKIIPRAKFAFEKKVLNVQFLTLKPIDKFRDTVNAVNIALVIGYEDGTIEIVQNSGEILSSLKISFPPILMSTSANYDDMKIAVSAPGEKLLILTFEMDKPKHHNSTESKMIYKFFQDTASELHSSHPTSLLHYVKTGKKFWVVGDKDGTLSLHLLNGTLSKHSSTKFGGIISLERFGQTLIFASESVVGVVNPNTLDISTVCSNIGKIHDVCIDTLSSSSIVYALANSSLVALDTKYSVGNEAFCKVLAIKPLKAQHSVLACARNYVVAWGAGHLDVSNTSFYIGGSYAQSLVLGAKAGSENRLDSYRIQNGGALMVASSESELYLYEVLLPYKTSVPYEFGNIRFLVIVFGIGGAMLWQYFKKGSGGGETKGKKYIPPRAKRRFK